MGSSEDRPAVSEQSDGRDKTEWWQQLRDMRRRRFAILCLVFAVGGGFVAGGFLRFTETTANAVRESQQLTADAIVVLTGGALRIQQAVDLLQEGKGERLLISGVNRETSPAAIADLTDADRRLFDCCVDVDFAAADTAGNATEAIEWAKKHGYDDIILVTSDYHMQRSLVEFERAGGIENITPYAVRRDDLWQDDTIPTTAGLKVLVTEYAKLMAARVRAKLVDADSAIAQATAAERLSAN